MVWSGQRPGCDRRRTAPYYQGGAAISAINWGGGLGGRWKRWLRTAVGSSRGTTSNARKEYRVALRVQGQMRWRMRIRDGWRRAQGGGRRSSMDSLTSGVGSVVGTLCVGLDSFRESSSKAFVDTSWCIREQGCGAAPPPCVWERSPLAATHLALGGSRCSRDWARYPHREEQGGGGGGCVCVWGGGEKQRVGGYQLWSRTVGVKKEPAYRIGRVLPCGR